MSGYCKECGNQQCICDEIEKLIFEPMESRDIKFRYVFKRKSDGHIYMIIVPIQILEEGHGEIFSMFKNDSWKLVARDQFVGLHEKNWKEIYERDILRSESTLRHLDGRNTGKISIVLRQVIWMDDGWGEKTIKNIQNYPGVIGFESKGIKTFSEFWEVVGNVYENPELLEGTN
jgi:uncharacterized phage protein (TIGR01671 family)